MKNSKFTILGLVILLSGCKQIDDKSSEVIENKIDTIVKTEIASGTQEDQNADLNANEIDSIQEIISLFKQGNVEKIANKINFPLKREYPIPDIEDKQEFINRFNTIFDSSFIIRIANSKLEQWSKVGWRGIMLDDGLLWMANSDGTITTVNYQSNYEKRLRATLITKEKERIHSSLKTFESPVYKLATKDYLIRIDQVNNKKYRYASWKIGENESSKPDLIIENGVFEFQGTGGNSVITFKQENYTYKIFKNVIGEENTPPISLEIEKSGKNILTQAGKLQ